MSYQLKSDSSDLDEQFNQIKTLLEKHRLVEGLVGRQKVPRQGLVQSIVQKRNLTELQTKLEGLHPADIAILLERLPLDDRLEVWDLVKIEQDGDVLLEVSDSVRETLIEHMDADELLAATESLDTDEIADLAPDLPQEVVEDVYDSLSTLEREQLRSAMSYSDDLVGARMDFDMVTVREDVTLSVVLRYLRGLRELPDSTDKIFVVDRASKFRGVLPLERLLVSNPNMLVEEVMELEVNTFNPTEKVHGAARAFEKYDLVSAPVIDELDNLIGRLTVAAVVDVIREESETELLGKVGLRDEDLFSSVWKSARNRWVWLAVNLCTAFFASRVIGFFEGSIEKLVALATLMPIVAAIAGNSGNQTITLIVRSLAVGDIGRQNASVLIWKELTVSAINGLIWGSGAGIIAWLIYGNIALGLVMMTAMLLNLVVAASVGTFVPLLLQKIGRDPAIGASVLLTFSTDSMGFLIFLGLATIFLV